MQIHTHIHSHKHTHVCTHTCTHIYAYTFICTHTHHIHTYLHKNTHMHTYMIQIHLYIHTHAHITHTYTTHVHYGFRPVWIQLSNKANWRLCLHLLLPMMRACFQDSLPMGQCSMVLDSVSSAFGSSERAFSSSSNACFRSTEFGLLGLWLASQDCGRASHHGPGGEGQKQPLPSSHRLSR